MKCKTCKHYYLSEMINHGAYGYNGIIPCLTCLGHYHYDLLQDNYSPIEPKEVGNEEPSLSKVILDKFLKHSKSIGNAEEKKAPQPLSEWLGGGGVDGNKVKWYG